MSLSSLLRTEKYLENALERINVLNCLGHSSVVMDLKHQYSAPKVRIEENLTLKASLKAADDIEESVEYLVQKN